MYIWIHMYSSVIKQSGMIGKSRSWHEESGHNFVSKVHIQDR